MIRCSKIGMKGILVIENLVFLVYFYGLYLYFSGFTSFHVSSMGRASFENLPDAPFKSDFIETKNNRQELPYKRHYRKFVFIIIDALRYDFIFSTKYHPRMFNQTCFPYVDNLIKNGKGIGLPVEAYSPTVTLPRIKSLVSGTLSSFFEVVTNFNAPELKEDNIVTQAYLQNWKVVFYGDNTWLNLFPKKFKRYEGTHSFYVSDYKEVDDNVTRHLSKELKENDWDMMILHYLGVDHIGHSRGPYSPLMPLKLKEMDNIIKNIYESLLNNSYSDKPDLIVICGDHGMTQRGTHGGNSENELSTPFIFLSTGELNYFINNYSRNITQIDIPVTLSVLLGLPVPLNSIGIVIPEILLTSGMSNEEVIYATYYNLFHLSSVYCHLQNKCDLLNSVSIREIIGRHEHWLKAFTNNQYPKGTYDYLYLLNIYMAKLHELKDMLVHKSVGYNIELMICGLIITLGVIVLQLNILNQLINTSTYSNTYISKCLMIICVCFVGFILLMIVFQDKFHIIFSIVFVITNILVFIKHRTINIIRSLKYTKQSILFFLLLLPVISLSSSSFIEEEHQVWYFLCTTVIMLYSVKYLLQYLPQALKMTSREHKPNKPTLSYTLSLQKKYERFKLFLIKSLVLLHLSRILRSWNQTGDKWAQLSDISDWLEDDKYYSLQILVLISEIVIFELLKATLSFWAECIFLSGLIWIHIYKFHSVIIKSTSMVFKFNEAVLGPRIIYIHIVFLLFIVIRKRFSFSPKYLKSTMNELSSLIILIITVWILLVLTIGQTYNMPLMALILLQEHLLYEITWKNNDHVSVNAAVYSIMTMCSFFYYGNSNNLATVDVFAGYTGITEYQPFLVGFLLACNTYSGPVLWILLLFYRMNCLYHVQLYSEHSYNIVKKEFIIIYLGIVTYRYFMLSVYLLVFYGQRYHLFVLSVFAPKLFYESFHTLIFFTVTSIVMALFSLH